MTVNEVSKLLTYISGAYTNFKIENLKATVAAWTDILKNETIEDLEKAVKIYVRQGNEFPPNPGQLLSIIDKYKPKDFNPNMGLLALKNALKNSAYGYVEEFENLPKVVQRVIGSPRNLHELGQRGMNSFDENNYLKRFAEEQDIVETRQRVGIGQNRIGIECN